MGYNGMICRAQRVIVVSNTEQQLNVFLAALMIDEYIFFIFMMDDFYTFWRIYIYIYMDS